MRGPLEATRKEIISVRQVDLRYGCNPHQGRARLLARGPDMPLTVLNGSPGYINALDALTAWQLVRELKATTGRASAASFKHVSPAGAATSGPISESFARSQFLYGAPTDAAASAYVRARGADRMSSFGDAAAVSEPMGPELAAILKSEVSDLVIAPAFQPEALDILRTKKGGQYLILQIDPDFVPDSLESRDVFGLVLEQERNDLRITPDLFRSAGPLPDAVLESLVVATTALKYTQSNSVCVAYDGQVIGIGAGQQSRIHCTRIACAKAEKWMLQTHPKVLGLEFPAGLWRPEKTNAIDQYLLWSELSAAEQTHWVDTMGRRPEPISAAERQAWFATFEGLVMSSDAFIPFRDNIDRAAMTGISYVAHAGGSIRDASVREVAREMGMSVVETGVRCFLH